MKEIFDLGNEMVDRVFVRGDVDTRIAWFKDHVAGEYKNTMAYLLAILQNQGSYALSTKPQTTIGTIHSVKGGEADVVYLFPDLSVAGMKDWEAIGERRDSVIRQFYVGATRAKETLVLCNQSWGSRYVPL